MCGAVAVPDYEGSEDYVARPLLVARASNGPRYVSWFGAKISSNLIDHENWGVGGIFQWKQLFGDADDSSPVVDEGSESQFIGGLYATYTFGS